MNDEILKCGSTEPPISEHISSLGCRLGIAVSGVFELTSRCNFSCPMCYIHSSENTLDEISAEQWLRLADEAKKQGLMFVLLTGGEPFIRRDFAQIYTGIIEMGIIVSINTNASLYNEELRKLFAKYPPARINVSLYGGSNECYSRMCGSPSFEKVYENIRKMKEDGLNVRLNTSLTPSNIDNMEKINDVASELNLHTKATTYMYPPVRIADSLGKNPARFSAEEAGIQFARWHAIHDSRERFSSRAGAMAASTSETSGTNTSRCRAGRCSFWVTSEGKMLPCGTMNVEPYDPFELGFNEAWKRVHTFVENIRMPDKCTTCPRRNYCGVCAAICVDETGSFSQVPEYVCTFSENLMNETIRIEEERKNADT